MAENKETREKKEAKAAKAPKESKAAKAPKESREPKAAKAPKEPRESKAPNQSANKKEASAPAGDSLACFVNRELSWLEFNRRVLLEADDPATPILERLKFLGIYQSNLEEFFMVRVGILTHRAQLMPDQTDPCSGLTAAEQLRRIVASARELQTQAERIWRALNEGFRSAGIDVLDFRRVSKVDELMSKKIFNDLSPLLLPRVVGSGDPLPFLLGKESYIVAWLGRNDAADMAIVPLTHVPPYIAFEINGRQKIVLTDQLIQHFLPQLFKKSNIRESAIIRVTRNADVFISEKMGSGEDLRVEMSALLKKRRRQQPVRLQIFGKLSSGAKNSLVKSLRLSEQSVFVTSVPFDMSFRSGIKSAPGMKYDERRSSRSIGLQKGEYFKYVEQHASLCGSHL